jgi:hypothetical protein
MPDDNPCYACDQDDPDEICTCTDKGTEMPEHPPEPWVVVPQPDGTWLVKAPSQHVEMGEGVIGSKPGRVVAHVVHEADARRIVACVNALDGLSLEQVGLSLEQVEEMARTRPAFNALGRAIAEVLLEAEKGLTTARPRR